MPFRLPQPPTNAAKPPSIHPLGDEQVHLVAVRFGAAGGPDQVLAVGAEDAEAVEAGGGGDALQALAVLLDRPEVEVEALGVDVGGEDDPLPIVHEVGTEVGGAV